MPPEDPLHPDQPTNNTTTSEPFATPPGWAPPTPEQIAEDRARQIADLRETAAALVPIVRDAFRDDHRDRLAVSTAVLCSLIRTRGGAGFGIIGDAVRIADDLLAHLNATTQ